ncbi:uncharacterized protein BX664DRAFT_325255 [Halteromyces radiatus]|uniref:uncharacterized protein n=1 Tax=Halteromyces radiatus TaxID=101107 RepID=UPI00221F697B|nr:uncharacterized protein BX664DRAFT_325255 [Halteromyces radiatus]KAI8096949.1 hypothetical protein BX664DRAFT_325255 [Halteromyces radiatus]
MKRGRSFHYILPFLFGFFYIPLFDYDPRSFIYIFHPFSFFLFFFIVSVCQICIYS